MDRDPNLSIHIVDDVAEPGGVFRCSVTRSPNDGEVNKEGRGKVRAVRITLGYFTEGRGTTDRDTVATVEMPVDEFGMTNGEVELAVPADAPISYDGRLIRVRWKIQAQTDIALAADPVSEAFVLVAPIGGRGLYKMPHPLSQSKS